MRRVMKWLTGLALAVILSIPVSASAASENQINLNVEDTRKGSPISGIEYSIYHVADQSKGIVSMKAGYETVITEPSVLLEQSHMAQAAEMLEDYINKEGTPSDQTLISNDAGKISFTNLEDGIYLIRNTGISKQLSDANYTYTAEAFLVAVPAIDKDGNIQSQVDCKPKGYLDTRKASTDITVNKIWQDNNDGLQVRPVSIQVALYENGETYDTVTLSAENNWTYLWKDLSADSEWTLKEITELEDYVAKVIKEGNVFTVTNTLTIPAPPGEYVYEGSVTINKKVTKGGRKKKIERDFYFNLFEDEELTKPATEKQVIKLKDASEGTTTFNKLKYGTYYIAETDEEGKPVDNSFDYEVVIDQPKVEVSAQKQQVTVTIENKEKETTPNQPGGNNGGNNGGSSTGGGSRNSVKTGDQTPIILYLGLFAFALVIILYLLSRKNTRIRK